MSYFLPSCSIIILLHITIILIITHLSTSTILQFCNAYRYLSKFLEDPDRQFHRVKALEVGHVSYGNGTESTQEPPFDWNDPFILKQVRAC